MTAPDLLPCPFCGGEAIRVDVGLSEFVDGEVTCEDCGGNVGNHPTKAKAIAAWNTRATPDATDPKVKALVEAIEDIRNYGTILTSRKRHAALDAALAALREGGEG